MQIAWAYQMVNMEQLTGIVPVSEIQRKIGGMIQNPETHKIFDIMGFQMNGKIMMMTALG